MKNSFFVSALIALMVIFISCEPNERHLGFESDTHGRGKATILIEESFKPLFETSIYTFESQFPHADIIPDYMAEGEIINDFFANKVKTICISRDFTEEEKATLRKKNVEVTRQAKREKKIEHIQQAKDVYSPQHIDVEMQKKTHRTTKLTPLTTQSMLKLIQN